MDRELILSLTVGLLAILNPVSALPYYMLSNPKSDKFIARKDARIMACAAFLIMLLGGFLGMELLGIFWLEMRYFRIAGWLLIAYNAFLMVTGSLPAGHHEAGKSVDDIVRRWLIIPLTMPLVAGPGSLAYLIGEFAYGSEYYLPLCIAICIGTLCFYLIIRYSFIIQKILWKLGIELITRFMWLLLLGIGVQVILMNL
jgi:multiple antibiotic resistance protein